VKWFVLTNRREMEMAKSNAGGGIQSNKLVRPGVRTGSGSKGVKPGYTSQLGSAKGTHLTEGRETPASKALVAKDAMAKPAGNTVPFGNAKALDVGKGGPGTGRVVMATGTQGVHGPIDRGNPRPVPKQDLLREFGPDVAGRVKR
jgi:hypothetical protein